MVENLNGAVLSKKDIENLIRNKLPLIEHMVDPNIQIQPNGIDLTVRSIERFVSLGLVDFDNKDRELPSVERIGFGSSGWLFLEPGAYNITFNEIVNIPLDLMGIAKPRSTLVRCGVTIDAGFIDAGYRGHLQCLLVVSNPNGFFIKKDARVLQIAFVRLTGETTGYNGRYQNE